MVPNPGKKTELWKGRRIINEFDANHLGKGDLQHGVKT